MKIGKRHFRARQTNELDLSPLISTLKKVSRVSIICSHWSPICLCRQRKTTSIRLEVIIGKRANRSGLCAGDDIWLEVEWFKLFEFISVILNRKQIESKKKDFVNKLWFKTSPGATACRTSRNSFSRLKYILQPLIDFKNWAKFRTECKRKRVSLQIFYVHPASNVNIVEHLKPMAGSFLGSVEFHCSFGVLILLCLL